MGPVVVGDERVAQDPGRQEEVDEQAPRAASPTDSTRE